MFKELKRLVPKSKEKRTLELGGQIEIILQQFRDRLWSLNYHEADGKKILHDFIIRIQKCLKRHDFKETDQHSDLINGIQQIGKIFDHVYFRNSHSDSRTTYEEKDQVRREILGFLKGIFVELSQKGQIKLAVAIAKSPETSWT